MLRVLQGPWSKEETDKLLELVKEKGRRWKAIGEELDRLPLSCRDQYVTIPQRHVCSAYIPVFCHDSLFFIRTLLLTRSTELQRLS